MSLLISKHRAAETKVQPQNKAIPRLPKFFPPSFHHFHVYTSIAYFRTKCHNFFWKDCCKLIFKQYIRNINEESNFHVSLRSQYENHDKPEIWLKLQPNLLLTRSFLRNVFFLTGPSFCVLTCSAPWTFIDHRSIWFFKKRKYPPGNFYGAVRNACIPTPTIHGNYFIFANCFEVRIHVRLSHEKDLAPGWGSGKHWTHLRKQFYVMFQ